MEKTLLALELEKEIMDSYPTLSMFYQEWMGNFELTENELKENLDEILKWLYDHPNWFLLFQHNHYYLTNF